MPTRSDTILGFSFTALGVVALVVASTLKPLRHIQYGPGLFPTIVGAGLIIFGLLLAFRSLRAANPDEKPAGAGIFQPRTPALFAAYLLAPLVYVVVAPVLGFLLTMPVIIAVLTWIPDRRPARAILLGLGITVLVHVVFVRLLRVPLPWGLLEPWAGVLT